MSEADNRMAMVMQARKYIGVTDSSHFVDVYNNAIKYDAMQKGWAWCACFVSAMAAECSFTDIIPMSLSCCQMAKLFTNKGRWIEDDGYEPKEGDIIFFDWAGSTTGDSIGTTESDHVGIVSAVQNGIIYTIEGNRSNAVKEAWYSVGSKNIAGFGVPDYGKTNTKLSSSTVSSATTNKTITALPTLKSGSTGNAVKAAQAIMNDRMGAGLDVDGSFGTNTLTAVKLWQTKKSLTVDGVVGTQTWKSFVT